MKKLLVLLCIIASFSISAVYAQDEDSLFTPEDSVSVFENNADENEQTTQSPDIVVLRNVPDTTVDRIKNEKAFAYANDAAYWVKEKKVYRKGFWDYVFDFFSSGQVRILFYTLLIGLAIFVFYRVIVLNNLLVFKRSKNAQDYSDDSAGMGLDRDKIDANIQEAIEQKNFPVAVRYLYLKTLYELSDRNLIHFHPEATNNQYLIQMSGHKKNKDFQFLTQVYEYIWYGKFQINEYQFSLVHGSFKNFHTGL